MPFVILERDRLAFNVDDLVSIQQVDDQDRHAGPHDQTRLDLRTGTYFYSRLSWDELCDVLAPVWLRE